MIASKLDAFSYCCLKLVCKGINTWIKDPPKLSPSKWLQFQSMIEAPHQRHKLQELGCFGCKKVLDKGDFSDTAARKAVDKGRLCIICKTRSGSKRNFEIKKNVVFGCSGCEKAQPLDKESNCLTGHAKWYEHFPRVRGGRFRASRNRRWCHSCWAAIENYRSLDNSP